MSTIASQSDRSGGVFPIATGGLLSIGKSLPAAILTMHQITPFLTVLSTAWLLWRVLPAQASLIP
jgi:hypothetical protein